MSRLFLPLFLGGGYLTLLSMAIPQVRVTRSEGMGDGYLHGYITDLSGAPAVARWDSIWYYGIAIDGYGGDRSDSRLTPAFLPLYSYLMRWIGSGVGCGYFAAGIWISRLALLAALMLLGAYIRQCGETATAEWTVPAALLAFPSAFILVSVYSEALFLALALGAFVLARQRKHGWAAIAASGASLTRIHGFALIPALAVLAWEQWRRGGPSLVRFAERADIKEHGTLETCPTARRLHWVPAMPALGGALAYLALGAYFWLVLGDPFAHFNAKREGWEQGFTAPWVTLNTALEHVERAATDRNLGSLYTILELPCFYLIVLTVGVLCARRWWPEATYVGCAGAMSLCSGSLAGLPRFTLVMFPVFIVLAGLRRWPVVWGIYLVASVVLQGCFLVNFVRFGAPPP